MIIESVCAFCCWLIESLFSGLSFISLPLDLINTLTTILQYGVWVVGADILLLFTGSVALWWGAKLSIGLGIWLYEHIPLVG